MSSTGPDAAAEAAAAASAAPAAADVATASPEGATPEGVVLGPDGKPLSKNQLKKLMKGKIPAPAASGGAGGAADAAAKKDKADKAEKAASADAGAAAAASKKPKAAVEKFEYVNTTPAGDKKDMSGEMLPAYHPQAVEAAWDAWWTKAGLYSCDPATAKAAGEKGRFVMVIPPPNVTGSLHLGHALTASIEDCLTRWHRMNGRPTMWLPGTDHAGIATQTVVEKRLKKEQNISRHDLGRETFVSEVWKWKETYGNRITSQLRHMGVSTDWSREAFTMDSKLSKAVTEAFVRLHGDGLIYRENRLVNWCCTLRSAISDIEVEYIDLEKRTRLSVPGHDPVKKYEFGCITSFAYKVEGRDEEIVVATTRPETMLGDTAVAVHPEDPRYKHLHGAHVIHPFDGRRLPIICDAELVDMSFGTGAVKITPAHDPNDFVCGKKHSLDFITVFTEDGRVNDRGGVFAGMMRFDAREAVTKGLEEKGLLRGKADNKMRLGLCSRTNDVIEPLIKPQWYVKCDTMAKRAADAVRSGELTIVPDMHKGTWFHWLDNHKDWCISRQLWWGHRIPAYSVEVAGKRGEESDPNNWVVARTEAEAKAIAAARFAVPESDIRLHQDEDVLDTWFSSGLFPFSTFGWPDETHPDFHAFYPNTLLETGWDILFFWVARMVMMGIQLTGKLPFKTVYLHAMVRDKYGRKMSKSLGNVVDPMEVIYGCDLETLHQKIREGNLPPKEVETAIKGQKLDFPEGIPECGADALRFGLLAYTLQGRDINLDINRILGYRQFCNKLWNATRFALLHLSADKYTPAPHLDALDELTTSPHLATRDKWILSRLNYAINTAQSSIEQYSFAEATTALFNFFLYELCDYYLELMKPLMTGDAAAAKSAGGDVALAQRLSRTVLHVCLDHGFRLLHPMMPFLTEELWQRLPGRGQAWRADGSVPDPVSVMVSSYPKPIPNATRPEVEAAFTTYQSILRGGRSLRSDADIPPSKMAKFYVVADEGVRGIAEDQLLDLMTLLRSDSVKVVASQAEVEEGCSVFVVSERCSVHLLLKGLIDPAAEIGKLEKRSEKVTREIEALRKKMSMATYAEKVPADVQAKDTEQLSAAEKQLEVLTALAAQYRSWQAEGKAAE